MRDTDKLPRNDGPLAEHGKTLLDHGYAVVPIAVGKKAPGFDDWSKIKVTRGQIDDWLSGGHRHAGCGIRTKDTPAVDLDIRNEAIALEAEAKCRELLGDAPLRIGRAPKRLLVYRTDKPFKKMRSTKFKDEFDQLHQIEILCDGQQFVAYHTHPDTGKPYLWPNEDGPLQTRAEDLAVINEEQCLALIAWFEERAKQESDWEPVKKALSAQHATTIDYDNPFIEDTQTVDISIDDLRARLLLVPNPDDHDTWFHVGMALYHQFDGGDEGFDLWNEWSETAGNYDRDALERRWQTFDVDGKKIAPLTARYILRLAKEALETAGAALAMKLNDLFKGAQTRGDWNKAKLQAREAELDALARSQLANAAKESLDRITQTKTPLVEVKKAIAFQPTTSERTPSWAESWVYDTSDDRFYCTARKISTTQQGFNAMYDRKAMTKKDVLDGKTAPSATASALALNLYKIPTVNGRRYEPGRDALFHETDGYFANTYPEHEIPEVPAKMTPRDKKAIERVKRHIKHLLSNPREQRLLLDWLSWVVQNPGRHANWSILLQGVEGDGKSFFGEMMRSVMGVSNVRMLNAKLLEQPFTDYVVGQCLTCIEEVRLIKANNKYEVLNTIKPHITNNIIEVHPKGKPQYNARNTTSYLLFSNFRDALPIDEDGRRFCVLFSHWQSRIRLAQFKDENTTYYEDLYGCIEECAPALRSWLLSHEQEDSFRPFGDAPVTEARAHMIRLAQPEYVQVLNELITEGNVAGVSNELVNLSVLNGELIERGVEIPHNKMAGTMLGRHGFHSIGRIMIDGEAHTFVTRRIELFQVGNDIDGMRVEADKVRKYYLQQMGAAQPGMLDDNPLDL
jgi:hypothetical protein